MRRGFDAVSPNFPELFGRFSGLARKGRLAALLLAFLGGAAVLAGGYLAASFVDIAAGPGTATRLFLLGATVAGCLWAAKRLGRARRLFEDELRAARRAEESFALGRTVSTAVEFGSDAEKTERHSSPELVGKLVESADERTRGLPLRTTLRLRPLAWVALAAFGVGLAVLLYALLLPWMARATAVRFFAPVLDHPPPSWTKIERVRPGDTDVPLGGSVRVEVETGGFSPEEVLLKARTVPGEGEPGGPWAESLMEEVAPGLYARTLSRVVLRTEYEVSAGDAKSRTFSITPRREPVLRSIRLTLVPPEYTGRPAETIEASTGDVRALVGTKVTIDLLVEGKRPVLGELLFQLDLEGRTEEVRLGLERSAEADVGEPGADREVLSGSFTVRRSGKYRPRLRDASGAATSDPPVFRITAVPDKAPVVRIKRPAREVMASRDQEVEVEIEATDDIGLSEVAIVHTLGGKPETMKLAGATTKDARVLPARFKMKLATRPFKGGEIITYYARARDRDATSGPAGKEARSDLHFIRLYDEERYGDMPGQRRKRPEELKEIERLITGQMDAMKETFEIARTPGREVPDEAARAEFDRARRSQVGVKKDLETLVASVEQALNMPGRSTEMRPEELRLLKGAGRSMGSAIGELGSRRAEPAVSHQSEALSQLSRTRRIILSQSSSSGTRSALQQASRDRRRGERTRRRRDLEEFDETLEKLPPILEKQEAVRRKLERLEDEMPEGKRRPLAGEQRRLAEKLGELGRKLSEMRERDPGMTPEVERRLLEAEQQMESAASSAEKGDPQSARSQAGAAEGSLRNAMRAGRSALREADKDLLRGAAREAEELARKQGELTRDVEGVEAEREGTSSAGSIERLTRAAEEEEALRKRLGELSGELEELARRAQERSGPEGAPLAEALSRQRMFGTDRAMDEASRALRAGRAEEALGRAREAGRGLEALKQDVADALAEAEASEGRRLASALERARQLTRELESITNEADTARSAALRPRVGRSKEEAEEIASAVRELPEGPAVVGAPRAEGTERSEAERPGRSLGPPAGGSALRRAGPRAASRSFQRAAGHLSGAEEVLRSAERASAGKERLRSALEEAALGTDILERLAQGELAEKISSARREMDRSAGLAGDARDQLSTGAERPGPASSREATDEGRQPREAGSPEGPEKRSRRAAAEAARHAGLSGRDLSSAASHAALTGSELEEALREEERRASRERLSERMASIAERMSEAGIKDELERARLTAEEAEERLRLLEAQAKGDLPGALRSAGERARDLARGLRELEETVAGADTDAPTRSEKERVRAVGERALGASEELAALERTVKRLAPEEHGRMERDERVGALREALEELVRVSSRNMPPRPTNALGAGAEAIQIVGEGLLDLAERLAPARAALEEEPEEVPEEFMELIERYFRALSEE